MGISGKKWIGVDAEVCADASGAPICAATQLTRVRPDGARVALGLPMDMVFFEKIEIPNVGWKAANGLVKGKFDLKLPVPIEKCLVVTTPVQNSPTPLFLAFAVTREAYKAHISAFRAATGCDPEAVFPSADALADACVRHLGGGTQSALLLHAAAEKWTLVAVENGVLSGVVTLPAGDAIAAMRNAKILSMRFQSPPTRFLVSGTDAAELAQTLVGAPNAMQCNVEAVPDPANFLAAALARRGASHKFEGGFRHGALVHPARIRRIARMCILLGLIPVALALVACVLAAMSYTRSSTYLAKWNAFLDQAATRVANGPLPQHGRAAVERAKGLLDWRNPAIASFAATSPLKALSPIFEAASTRGMTFSSIDYEGQSLAISGHGAVEADVEVLRQAAEKAGFAFEATVENRGEGIAFSATITAREGGEP
jgi:hypothetical protein